MNRIVWHPHLSAPLTAVYVLLLAWWVWVVCRRNRLRFTRSTALLLTAPRALVGLLLCTAILDPWYRSSEKPKERPVFLSFVDGSASMDTADRPDGPRVSRARQAAAALADELKDDVAVETRDFDGDVASLLAELQTGATAKNASAAALFTDGSDDRVRPTALPITVHVVGFGSDPAGWNDLAIADLKAPERIDEGVAFKIQSRIVAHADEAFGKTLAAVPVVLEERVGDDWGTISEAKVDLSRGAAEPAFDVQAAAAGGPATRQLRLRVGEMPGELSTLDNAREFRVETRSRRIHVLFFARSLDWNFSQIRAELKRDPDIRLTALYRKTPKTSALEGDRREGDAVLEAGLPEDPAALALYRPIILGAFPPADLTDGQAAALRDYVDRGGSLIFLGGQDAIGGDWIDSPLEPLLPWKPRRQAAEMLTGAFPVGVPASSREHPAIAQAAEALAAGEAPTLSSLNDVGDLKPGAVALLDATVGGQQRCVVAVEPYGRGQSAAVATDTMWQWRRRPGVVRDAFAKTWQQLVRSLAGSGETGGGLRIEWDKPRYLPSEAAVATVTAVGQDEGRPVTLKAELQAGEARMPVAVTPVPGVPGRWSVSVAVGRREEHRLFVEAVSGDETIGRLESRLDVAPRAGEGSRLDVDMAFLGDLAARSGGLAVLEDASDVAAAIRRSLDRTAVMVEHPLVETNYVFLGILLCVLIAEWMMRRAHELF